MNKILFPLFLLLFLCLTVWFIKEDRTLKDFTNVDIKEVEAYCNKMGLVLEIEKQYSNDIEINKVIEQNIEPYSKVKKGDLLKVVVSLGKNLEKLYREYAVDELGRVPIMMYHGIHNIEDNQYTGGNVDTDGYQRTAKAFREDLEFYYQKGYRMIRLEDYIQGIIDVSLGNSPIILTFDDGLSNNIKVLGRDESGELIIDPNSAVGILETYKQKYPDYGVTATFFINDNLFGQPEYDEDIITWLIQHGYDIGNHTISHADLGSITEEQTIKEIGGMYQKLDKIIGNAYVSIVALPFGKPYTKEHSNFGFILEGTYDNLSYQTEATLRVGWESELSPFDKNFDKTYLKRIRAYDNNGADFDITYNFNLLEKERYISDGNKDTVVTVKEKQDKIDTSLQVILYE